VPQKTVKFQAKIDLSALEKTQDENITLYSMANSIFLGGGLHVGKIDAGVLSVGYAEYDTLPA
jgi:hypothetical protein